MPHCQYHDDAKCILKAKLSHKQKISKVRVFFFIRHDQRHVNTLKKALRKLIPSVEFSSIFAKTTALVLEVFSQK